MTVIDRCKLALDLLKRLNEILADKWGPPGSPREAAEKRLNPGPHLEEELQVHSVAQAEDEIKRILARELLRKELE